MPAKTDERICFFIAPIGAAGSEERKRSDQVLKYIVRPAAKETGYRAVRADEISEPGTITAQVIEHVVDDDLVIADLTGWNPNVFYELAIRHAFKKPVILIIHHDQSIPFDISTERTILFDYKDLDSAERCRSDIVKQIQAIEASPNKVDSPISRTLNLQSLRGSDNPPEKFNAEIMSMLQQLSTEVAALRRNVDSSMRLGTARGGSVVVGEVPPVPPRLLFSSDVFGLGSPGKVTIVKTCPSCKSSVDFSANVCPQCGTNFGFS